MLVIGEKENRSMKKKTNKNSKSAKEDRFKNQKSPKGMANQKIKQPALKVVKESQAVYHSDKESVKSPSYTNGPIGKIEIVRDFLPSPDELVLKDATVKVTLNLSKSSIDFFKSLAQKNGSQYQKVIRNLLDSYTTNYSK